MKSMTWIAGVLLAASGSVWAQAPTTVIGVSPYIERVTYQPSELASQDGIHDLRGRVRSAAHRVCELGDSWTADYRERICFQATLPEAMAQVDQAVARLAHYKAPNAGRIVVAAR